MWLINIELEWFDSEDYAPPYAILSHIWVHGAEVAHQCWKTVSHTAIRATSGGLKIVKCCEMAKRNGIAYVWVDTCCIDKAGSAELSEAINSMFRWYQKAEVCYAYLADITGPNHGSSLLSNSKWFTRRWTLQELIAQREMFFYAADWSLIGTRETTTRLEDLAYCLPSIVDITILLIYGEVQKAFRRLQEEIIKLYPDDHSIYAWGPILELDARSTKAQLRPPEQLNQPLLGLLAQSPRDFVNSGGVSPVPWIGRFYRMPGKAKPTAAPLVIVGKGIKIDLPARFGKF
ncbi:heterokaryon incompatibility protein-domain-containing protein [Xylaria cf. heliscus]|nr:heterokaryon incompatibility protein-domain-containing protein [Xylaria cf. heliscus]